MADESEEKSEQASDKKLRDGRKKGQVAQSKDTAGAAATGAILIYFWLAWDFLSLRLQNVIQAPADSYELPFKLAAASTASEIFWLAVMIVAPLLVLALVFGVLGAVMAMGGLVFSTHPIVPDFNRINPMQGMKRIFSMRGAMELLKSTVKMLIIIVIGVVTLYLGLNTMLHIPGCGLDCLFPAASDILQPLFISIVVLLVILAFADFSIQRFLFMRDMRMTKTEVKREYKEQDGDPLLKSARKQIARDNLNRPGGGVKAAAVVITSGKIAVALHYDKEEGGLPIVIAKGQGSVATRILSQAQEGKVPVVDDDVGAMLFEDVPLDYPISEDSTSDVARILGNLSGMG